MRKRSGFVRLIKWFEAFRKVIAVVPGLHPSRISFKAVGAGVDFKTRSGKRMSVREQAMLVDLHCMLRGVDSAVDYRVVIFCKSVRKN